MATPDLPDDDEMKMKKFIAQYKAQLTPEDLKWYERDHGDLVPFGQVVAEMEEYVRKLNQRA